MKRYNYILLLLIVALFNSCTKEIEPGGSKPLPEGSVRIMLTNGDNLHPQQAETKAGEPPVSDDAASENYVKKIQVFFYNTASGKLECVRQYLQGAANNEITWLGAAEMVVNRVSKLGEAKDIYVVTNWMADLPAEISIGSTVEELTKQLTALTADKRPFTPSESTPLLMSGKTTAYQFHEEGQTSTKTATITLQRQMVKIEVKVLLESNFSYAIEGNCTFSSGTLSVYNMPSQSFVLERDPATLPASSTMLDPFNITTANSDNNTWNFTFYSYENPQTGKLPGDKAQSTYFDLNLTYLQGNNPPLYYDNYYRIYIDDTNDATNPHKTLRNNHYTVTVIVTGFGMEKPAFDATHAVTTVTPWITDELEQELPGKDMIINKTMVELDGTTLDQSIMIRDATDVDPLKLSFSAIAYPSDAAENEKNLEVKVVYDANTDKKSFAITIQNKAAAIYKKELPATFYLQYGTYKKRITAYLSVYVPEIDFGYFGGDPTNTMEGEGTMYPQQLIVSSVANTETYTYNRSGQTNLYMDNSFYYGKAMILQANSAIITNYMSYFPIMEYCVKLNKDLNNNGKIDNSEIVWYTPAYKQLLAMLVFNAGLDVPLMYESVFWSVTEADDQSAMYISNSIFVVSASTGKSNPQCVRCVRDL